MQTYNTLMSVCARASDRKGLYSYFKRLQQSGLRPTAATYNVLLSYHARRAETAQACPSLPPPSPSGSLHATHHDATHHSPRITQVRRALTPLTTHPLLATRQSGGAPLPLTTHHTR